MQLMLARKLREDLKRIELTMLAGSFPDRRSCIPQPMILVSVGSIEQHAQVWHGANRRTRALLGGGPHKQVSTAVLDACRISLLLRCLHLRPCPKLHADGRQPQRCAHLQSYVALSIWRRAGITSAVNLPRLLRPGSHLKLLAEQLLAQLALPPPYQLH